MKPARTPETGEQPAKAADGHAGHGRGRSLERHDRADGSNAYVPWLRIGLKSLCRTDTEVGLLSSLGDVELTCRTQSRYQ